MLMQAVQKLQQHLDESVALSLESLQFFQVWFRKFTLPVIRNEAKLIAQLEYFQYYDIYLEHKMLVSVLLTNYSFFTSKVKDIKLN